VKSVRGCVIILYAADEVDNFHLRHWKVEQPVLSNLLKRAIAQRFCDFMHMTAKHMSFLQTKQIHCMHYNYATRHCDCAFTGR